jgi:hypothetical protein
MPSKRANSLGALVYLFPRRRFSFLLSFTGEFLLTMFVESLATSQHPQSLELGKLRPHQTVSLTGDAVDLIHPLSKRILPRGASGINKLVLLTLQ